MENTIKSTGYSSDRYGECEICTKHASEIYILNKKQGKKIILFGHKNCLKEYLDSLSVKTNN